MDAQTVTPSRLTLPRLYAILDAGLLLQRGIRLETFAHALRGTGIRFLQFRDKNGDEGTVLDRACILRRIFPASDSTLVLNDHAHLCAEADFDGVHIGQHDGSPKDARRLVGPNRIVGLSTHNVAQVEAALHEPVDYLAIGPVFGTKTKQKPDPVVGIEGVQAARALTRLPLVAIGGISVEASPEVIAAGADAVALISALAPHPLSGLNKVVQDIRARIG